MKRRNFKALVTNDNGLLHIDTKDTFAWNSAIKATEAIVRQHARDNQTIYTGGRPSVHELGTPERTYTRSWTAKDGTVVEALVWEVL